MYAYCGNNPVLYEDSSGARHEISAGGVSYRDVTEEINLSLQEECRRIKKFQAVTSGVALSSATTDPVAGYLAFVGASGVDFYRKVDHRAPWDIKRPKPWRDTIGTRSPDGGHPVLYDGMVMTPEMLGNFTYGYLGYHYGFILPILYAGSYYAAGFPTDGEDLDNELWDWEWITKGYSYALLNR